MKTRFFLYIIGLLVTTSSLLFTSCNADEEVYLTTDRTDAYISALQLYASDNRNAVLPDSVFINEEQGTIKAVVKSGSNPARLKPRCTLAPEATLAPKMGVWTDFSTPAKYTVTSGNGKIKKEYTITVVEQK